MKRITVGAAAVAAVFAFGACGTGGTDDAAEDMSTPDETASAPAETGSGTEAAPVPDLLDFTTTTVDGEPFEGASLAGSPAVLWFWQEDCPICQGQGPDVAALIADHGDEVNIVGVAGTGLYRTSTDEQLLAFVEDTGTDGATHLQSPDGELWTRFGVTSQSTYVLLDSSGEIIDSGSFPADELDDKVADLS
jgi:cytochrome oxidase Cu insertion factor (SCO1/SenC/PrrC family)